MPFFTLKNNKIHSIKLEFNLTSHCNFSCAECSHFSPHMKPVFSEIDNFKHDLNLLNKVYHVQRFRFVGGEPFLHKNIIEFINAVRDSKIADKIQICSNGSLAHKLDDSIFKKIDMLSISWYPDSRCDQQKINLISRKCEEYSTELKIEKISTFRQMQLDDAISGSKLLTDIFESCQIAHTWGCQTFYNGNFYLCSRPIFTQEYLKLKSIDSPNFKIADGLPLNQPNLLSNMIKYMERKSPLKSCHYCLGTIGKDHTWKTLEKNERRHPLPIKQEASKLIDSGKLKRLITWKKYENIILGSIPSLSLSRILNLIKNHFI